MLNKYIKVFDWYIIKKYLGTFVFTIAIFVVVIVVFDVSEKLDNFLKANVTLNQIIFQYYAGSIPFYIDMLSPLINFLAVIFFTAKMANQTEIVPILSGGASFNRFLRPYFICASLIFTVSLFADIYLIPFTNQLKNTFENSYVVLEDHTKVDVHIQLDKNTFVYMQTFNDDIKTGYMFTLEKFNGDVMKQKLTANSIGYDTVKHRWTMHGVDVRYVNGLREKMVHSETKDTVLEMVPADFVLHNNIYNAMSMSELNKKIDNESMRGTGVLYDMLFEKYYRFVHPFAAFVLTLIGVSLSSRKVRGGVGLPLGIGFFLCFAYIVVDRFANVFSLKGGLHPIIAVCIPNLLFGLLGYYLLRKAPK
ncbi:lipopolysaccharide export system permease protein [Mucilaginibacter gracilis]|uniref:Lipopolysaccharide export system permease protein n=1 Tax=Mucilaginibacter gracilis TaxID=423350 RepID=A0A495JA54_9SPHI|nr:LptF/LptG family permease [Mucilaginibacter gracilis]RKR85242.1 lipopolysaccharide export system permease protein [Mucilaginibacter gracilis]